MNNIPKELLDKIMMPKIDAEISADTPDLPKAEIIMAMPMPGGKAGEEPEKEWGFKTDWLCSTDECLLFVSCVSDDGKAWFIKEFDNLQEKDDKDKYMDKMLQNAKGCTEYHYYLGECGTAKLKDNPELQKILPEGKLEGENKFKDYQVPANLEDLAKLLKEYCKYSYKNPCGE